MVTISAFYYFLTAGLFNTQFLRDSFIRVVLFVVSQSAALVVRVDENEVIASLSMLMITCWVLLVEVIFYNVHKDKAKLFLGIMTGKQHQKQLVDLLDTLPDKVLICHQKHDNRPVPVYTNLKMK